MTKLLATYFFLLMLVGCTSAREASFKYQSGLVLLDLEERNKMIFDNIEQQVDDSLVEIITVIKLIDELNTTVKSALDGNKRAYFDTDFTYTYFYILADYGPQMHAILRSYFNNYSFVNINPGLASYNFNSETWLEKLARYYPLDALIGMENLKYDLIMYCYIIQKI